MEEQLIDFLPSILLSLSSMAFFLAFQLFRNLMRDAVTNMYVSKLATLYPREI